MTQPFQPTFGPAGPIPTPPATLRAIFIAAVTAVRPGITMDLPASLIEDITSTSVGALVINDQAVIDLLNSIASTTANPFLLNQLGQQFGVEPGEVTNTSVFEVFTGTPGFIIGKGFIVSDGLQQYALADGGIIGSDGQSAPLFAVASASGTWAVPAGTVNQIITSVPSPFALTVTNPQPGIPGNPNNETEASYRSRVVDASQANCQGMLTMLRTLVGEVDGVQSRLINAIPQPGGGWEIIVGGGDPFEVAYAIYLAIQDVSTLVGSKINVTGITNANPGVVSTDITHNYAVGQVIAIAGTSPNDYNASYAVLSVPTSTSFALGMAYVQNALTALSWAATGGGQVTAVTTTAHGVTVGSTFIMSGNAPAGYNGTFVAIAGTTGSTLIAVFVSNPGAESQLGFLAAGIANVNTTSTTPWVSGGVVTPNFRNVAPSIIDYPDEVSIPFAVPPEQVVTMTITWNTTSPDFVSEAAVAQAVAPAMADYVNNILQGGPLNELSMDAVFEAAVANILPPTLISRLVYAISIDGVGKSVSSGTRLVFGDPQSFLGAEASGVSVVIG